MRTSLSEIKEIDAYLHSGLSIGNRLVFEARMLLNKKLRKNVALQRETYALIRLHHHATLKEHLRPLHRSLFHDPANADLKKEIVNLFTS